MKTNFSNWNAFLNAGVMISVITPAPPPWAPVPHGGGGEGDQGRPGVARRLGLIGYKRPTPTLRDPAWGDPTLRLAKQPQHCNFPENQRTRTTIEQSFYKKKIR